MPRFFISPRSIADGYIQLDQESLAHLRVLRLGPRETFVVSDGAGRDYQCILAEDRAEIISISDNSAEPTISCTVYLAYAKGERMDYAVQKSVELGADRICLFPSDRCVVKIDEKGLPKKLARWGRIALEAAKQSGRGKVPTVGALPDYQSAITQAAGATVPLFLYEGEDQRSLRTALEAYPQFDTVSLVIGPEGGFTEAEVRLAQEAGLLSVSLGKRILRCETAPVAALAAVMVLSGN